MKIKKLLFLFESRVRDNWHSMIGIPFRCHLEILDSELFVATSTCTFFDHRIAFESMIDEGTS